MGRTYLSPRNRLPTAFWINFGAQRGHLCFPDWIPELESVCTREAYEELVSDLKAYFENIRPNHLSECSLLFFCLIVPIVYYCYRIEQMKNGIREILQRHMAKFKSPNVVYQFVQQSAPIPRRDRAFDHQGYCLETVVNYDPHTTQIRAVWPPLGHNIVLHLPQPNSIRSRWPPKPEVDPDDEEDGPLHSREEGRHVIVAWMPHL
jgi:hypothetical protein